MPVGVSITPADKDETTTFLREMEVRHALACAMRLKNIILDIERRPSTIRVLTRTESKGTLRGRLDIPRYVVRRAQHRSLPRTYPILISEEGSRTPENSLIVQALRGLENQLGKARFPRNTAEGKASAANYDWVRTRLQRLPWAAAGRVSSSDRLRREAMQRIRKRQTGNEPGYSAFLKWFAEWQVDLEQLGADGAARVGEGLLAFPLGESFWDKVFEIWCLREVARSLQRCSCELVEGPQPLHRRTSGPIYRLRHDGADIQVWFQRQSPLGAPRWRYVHSGHSLAGIPDIVVTSSDHTPLLIDAKRRAMVTRTRAEETYKVLGYLENFRDILGTGRFQGLLAFVGHGTTTTLTGPNHDRLVLVAIDEALASRGSTAQLFDSEIEHWLDSHPAT